MAPPNPKIKSGNKEKFFPFAGCSLFIVIGFIVAGMMAFFIWQYFKTKKIVASFTQEQAKVTRVESIKDKEFALVELKRKLIAFRYKVETKQLGEMTLDAEEMNIAIATFDILKTYRGMLFIQKISPDGISARISFLTRWKMRSDAKRYLNAKIVIEPVLVEGSIFPKIIFIYSDKKGAIPEPFKQFISEVLLKPLYDDKEIGPIFKSISGVKIAGDKVVLNTAPDFHSPPQSSLPKTQRKFELMIARALKGFSIIAVVFLVLVILVIILAQRKNIKSNTASH